MLVKSCVEQQARLESQGLPCFRKMTKGLGGKDCVFLWVRKTMDSSEFITEVQVTHADPGNPRCGVAKQRPTQQGMLSNFPALFVHFEGVSCTVPCYNFSLSEKSSLGVISSNIFHGQRPRVLSCRNGTNAQVAPDETLLLSEPRPPAPVQQWCCTILTARI